MPTTPATPTDHRRRRPPTVRSPFDLAIGGMTCASCAARIERRLNKLDGVTATVNYATERANVHAPAGVAVDDLIAQVEAAGYTARDARPAGRDSDAAAPDDGVDEARRLRDRLDHLGRPHGAGRAAGDDPGPAVRVLAVALADAGRAGRDVGCVAVPPGGVDEPAPRHGHDGHAHLARRAGRLRVVAVRPVPRRRRRARHDPRLHVPRRARRGRAACSTSRSPPA